SAAMRERQGDGSKRVTRRMGERSRRSPSHRASTPMPTAVIGPSPVIATRWNPFAPLPAPPVTLPPPALSPLPLEPRSVWPPLRSPTNHLRPVVDASDDEPSGETPLRRSPRPPRLRGGPPFGGAPVAGPRPPPARAAPLPFPRLAASAAR